MHETEANAVVRRIASGNTKILRLLFTDIRGRIKSITLPAAGCAETFREGVGFDATSLVHDCSCGEGDMRLVPDPATCHLWPDTSGHAREARFFCSVMDRAGRLFDGDPRAVLKRSLDDARKDGYDLFTGPEMEFWLFHAPRKRSRAPFHDRGTYFDLFPADKGVDIRREIVLALTEMGYQVEASHHEVARGQHEIPFRYGPALATADRIISFREVARAVAARYGATASFIAKPEAGMNGNAMHIHASLKKDGKNAFFDPKVPDGISRTALFFIGGLLAHAKALCRVANPTINSYKRLTPGYEAPCMVTWSAANRSALIRVPAARGEGTRVELRNPDGMANPYLLLAAMLAAGMDGVRRELLPPEVTNGNAYSLPGTNGHGSNGEMLPANLEEAQECLRADWLLCKTLGPLVVNDLDRIAEEETESFRTAVHPWEIQRYLQSA